MAICWLPDTERVQVFPPQKRNISSNLPRPKLKMI
jgi:hypothetical protein